ncbi:hypothetical protein, conserved [Leishmania donovani]|uniref:Uncharacterized protein n=1 Tax=Leishmania donovani TaxID=5661 RepID=E9BQJ7_LEIDO|nr:hypothetical protein, conserved [Leishmania donovani]TPP39956.1 hypothetical protein CGC21_25550 [Leishmania donovani]CBZ37526.1 hypothetical protein, conserved [Leishmania donovani]
MSARPSDGLACLHEELEQEEKDLAALEDNVEAHAAQLGYLHTEYTLNKTRVCHHYEPRLEPLRVITYAAAQKESLIAFQIEWLERKIVVQERHSQGGQFIETRDMKPAAEEYQNKARQSLLRCYEHISECPEEALHIISQYVCPPEEAIATMELVMKVRGEPPEACTWEASQVLFSYTYFHEFFATRSEALLKTCDLLSDALMTEVEHFCADPHHSVSALCRISIPIGCMGEWLHSIRNYYRVKLVTAPVLLSQSADTGRMAKQAQAWLAVVTLGEVNNQAPPQQPTTAAKHAVTEDAELGALVAAYEASKENLQLSTEPVSVTAATVHKLRHRLHKLRESVRAAEEERMAIEGELQAKLAEVRGNYDETMVPLEDQLEEMTECFVQRATRKVDVAAAPPSPVTTAANIADNAAAVAAAG